VGQPQASNAPQTMGGGHSSLSHLASAMVVPHFVENRRPDGLDDDDATGQRTLPTSSRQWPPHGSPGAGAWAACMTLVRPVDTSSSPWRSDGRLQQRCRLTVGYSIVRIWRIMLSFSFTSAANRLSIFGGLS
jgi:hypothetical protein